MVKLTQVAILFIGAFCLMASSAIAQKTSHATKFYVEGEVYCDVCRADFVNKLSQRMAGANVRLQCKDDSDKVTYSVDGMTGENGVYRIAVEGDHDAEECEIKLLKSSRPDCSELPKEGWAAIPASRVDLTVNTGISDKTRHANPLSFLTKTTAPGCDEVFKDVAEGV